MNDWHHGDTAGNAQEGSDQQGAASGLRSDGGSQGARPARILLADDDALVLSGLSTILSSFDDLEVLAAVGSGREALDFCRRERPDVAVLDIRMPELDGIQTARLILEEHLSAPLLLTTFDEPELITRALEVGAHGYVLKNSPVERLHFAIVTVAAGGTVFSPDVLDFIRTQVRVPVENCFAALTEREREVVALIAEGFSNEQIAERLYLAHGTVRNHISAILEKTGLTHRTQIAVRYLSDSSSSPALKVRGTG